jgi:predicted GNAT superfamily acetyltransferase
MSSIEIKPVTELDDVGQLENIQRATWQMSDLEMIPGRFMHVMQLNGACLLGAYDRDQIVGFVFGLLGTVEGLEERADQVAAARLKMYSVIMGVLPEYQVQGIGYRLKLAQREFAVRIGVRMISWTFDALESRNAYFNLTKLGVICHRYIRNYHGDLGGLNAGLTTDRLYVEWWVTSNRVENRLASETGPLSNSGLLRKRGPLTLDAYLQGGAILINEAHSDERGLPTPPASPDLQEERIILLEIPSNTQKIKKIDMSLARVWRDHTRRLFEHYFQKRYMITDFVLNQTDDGKQRSLYVLTRVDS